MGKRITPPFLQRIVKLASLHIGYLYYLPYILFDQLVVWVLGVLSLYCARSPPIHWSVRLGFSDYLSYSVVVEFDLCVGFLIEPCVGVYLVVWMLVR
jgi:hypothetical protein